MASHVGRLRNNHTIQPERIEETLSLMEIALTLDASIYGDDVYIAAEPVRKYLNNMLRIHVTPSHNAYVAALEAHMDDARTLLQRVISHREHEEHEEHEEYDVFEEYEEPALRMNRAFDMVLKFVRDDVKVESTRETSHSLLLGRQ